MSQSEPISDPPPAFTPVAKAGALVAVTAALCRLASVGKELLVAYVLGAGLATDAYALVMLIPGLTTALLVYAVRSAFLTLYPQQAMQGADRGRSLANRFIGQLTIVSASIAAVGGTIIWWTWPLLLRFADLDLVRASRPLLWPAAGLVVATALVAGLSAILNAYGRFSTPQSTAIVPTVVVVIAVAYWGRAGGAWALVGGLLAGTVVQCLVLMFLLLKSGHRFQVSSTTNDLPSSKLWRLALPIIAVSVLSQVNVYVDRTMASSLATGSVAVLAWSGMVRDLVAGTLIGAFISVLLPHFSTLTARGNLDEVSASCNIILRTAGVLLFPVTAVTIVCAPLLAPYVAVGRFDERDAMLLAGCIAAYSAGFFADMASNALFQGLLGLRRVRLLWWLSLFASFIPNIVLNLLLLRPFGAVGLALSTSLVGYITLLANYGALRRMVSFKREREMWMSVLTSLALATVAGLLGFAAGRAMMHVTHGSLWAAVVAGLVCVASYLLLSLVYPRPRDAVRVANSLRYLFARRRR